jgi:hypothetical protein
MVTWRQWNPVPRVHNRRTLRSAAAQLLGARVRITVKPDGPSRLFAVCCLGSSFYDKLIIRSHEFYRVCISVCDLATSVMRKRGPWLGCCPTEEEIYIISVFPFVSSLPSQAYTRTVRLSQYQGIQQTGSQSQSDLGVLVYYVCVFVMGVCVFVICVCLCFFVICVCVFVICVCVFIIRVSVFFNICVFL